jgi:hypothetical protein
MYHCDVCNKWITATPGDAVHKTSAQTLCSKCLSLPSVAPPKKVDGRGEGARARWANMTAEEKAERVKKMRAGKMPASGHSPKLEGT